MHELFLPDQAVTDSLAELESSVERLAIAVTEQYFETTGLAAPELVNVVIRLRAPFGLDDEGKSLKSVNVVHLHRTRVIYDPS